MVEITLIAGFVAGIISFLSPCVLPLIPGFLAYLAGTSIGQERLKLFLNSVAYVLGFSSVFALLGILLTTVLVHAADSVQLWLSRIGGAIIIVFGLHLLGLIKIPFLLQDKEIKVKRFNSTYLTSFLFGAAFAAGWSPCVGPILGSVLALAASNPATSFWLLLVYSLGLGIPFLIVGLFASQALALIKRYSKFLKYFNIVVGILLLLLGVLVFTQTLNYVANLSIINYFLLR